MDTPDPTKPSKQKPTQDTSILMTKTEAAALIRMSKRAFDRYCEIGVFNRLPGPGRDTLVKRDEVEAFRAAMIEDRLDAYVAQQVAEYNTKVAGTPTPQHKRGGHRKPKQQTGENGEHHSPDGPEYLNNVLGTVRLFFGRSGWSLEAGAQRDDIVE